MSWDVRLYDPETNKAVPVESHTEGGTYVMGGLPEAVLNITWNYSWFYYRVLDKESGLRWIYGKTGEECAPRLEKAVEELGTRRNADYWADTPGNAGHALNILLGWAKQHPTAVFEGD